VQRFLFAIDRLSAWTGKAAAWLVLLMTLLISWDVVMRYASKPVCEQGSAVGLLCAPVRALWFTYDFAYDMTYYLYAVLFMLGGAYALSRGQHLRGDVFYRLWPVKTQASIDLLLYIVAFFPGILALISVGLQWGLESMRIGERSFTTAVAPPIWPLKLVIPLAGTLMAIQGLAETIRAFQALRTGVWPQRLHDVEETETLLAQQEAL
jgi:TRAP-type mannitol/chloroaromatic compound transport system permease small subunit